ncbi:MAG: magnesium protoporphyrin IX methyltransferase [Pseudomonadota bacterium]
MTETTYTERRSQLETYFDRTASEAWAKLTSDAPVSRIRATVRAGRDAMRDLVLSWLPEDLTGARLLDAGCGPGQFALEAARRGADVLGVDLSPTLLNHARERIDIASLAGSIDLRAGDMLDPSLGEFDYVVALDSLIHYQAKDMASSINALRQRTTDKVIFTFAPRTAALTLMHTAGNLFPKSDRAPAIEPVSERRLSRLLADGHEKSPIHRTQRVSSGFYISQAMEVGGYGH